ncbi:MAG: M20 peptidase family dipeptidase, partial [Hyphomicrobiaceae bacterium]
MTTSGADRARALETSEVYFESGDFARDLDRLVGARTNSQDADAMPVLTAYLSDLIAPKLRDMGFHTQVLDNPIAEAGPLMLAERHEDAAYPTILIYGHGDVVPGQDELWRPGLAPWTTAL